MIGVLGAGRYQIAARIGAGGMAEVWRAWDSRLQVWRAIKTMKPDLSASSVARRRFEQEARAMARLSHPHILAIRDVAEEDGNPYLVMDLADGGSLAEVVGAPLPPATAARVAEEVLRALDHAHRNGVVHRDVKPQNVLLHDGHALVSDFGIARVVATDSGLTRTGAVVGTLAFMAPEQRSSASDVDGRADVYAAAATLYWLVTLREPLDLYVDRPDLFDGLPPGLADVIRRGTAYRPDERFPDAAAMADALAALRPALGPETPLPERAAPREDTSSDTWSASTASTTAPTGAFLTPAPGLPAPAPALPAPRTRSLLGWALGLGGAASAALALAVALRPRDAPPVAWVDGPAFGWLAPGDELLGTDGVRALVRGSDDVCFEADASDGGHRVALPWPAVWIGGRSVGVEAADGSLRLHDGETARTFPMRSEDRAMHELISPDASHVVARVQGGGLEALGADGGRRRLGGEGSVFHGAWSPDGERLAAVAQRGFGGVPVLALYDRDAVRYLDEGDGLVVGTGPAVAWLGPHTVGYTWLDADGLRWIERDVDGGGEPRSRVLPGATTDQALWTGSALIYRQQRHWIGATWVGPDGTERAATGDDGRRTEPCGSMDGAVALCDGAGGVLRWDPASGEAPTPVPAGWVGTWKGHAVTQTDAAVAIEDPRAPLVLPPLEGTLRCAFDTCWLRSGDAVRRFEPGAAEPLGPAVALPSASPGSWAPAPGGALVGVSLRDGLAVVEGDHLRAMGTFGNDFFQDIASDGAGGAWLSGFRAPRWVVGHWTPEGGWVEVRASDGWVGRLRPLGDGLVVAQQISGPSQWRRWGPGGG